MSSNIAHVTLPVYPYILIRNSETYTLTLPSQKSYTDLEGLEYSVIVTITIIMIIADLNEIMTARNCYMTIKLKHNLSYSMHNRRNLGLKNKFAVAGNMAKKLGSVGQSLFSLTMVLNYTN